MLLAVLSHHCFQSSLDCRLRLLLAWLSILLSADPVSSLGVPQNAVGNSLSPLNFFPLAHARMLFLRSLCAAASELHFALQGSATLSDSAATFAFSLTSASLKLICHLIASTVIRISSNNSGSKAKQRSSIEIAVFPIATFANHELRSPITGVSTTFTPITPG